MLSCSKDPNPKPCLGERAPFGAPLVLGLALLWLLLVWTSLDHLPPDPPSTDLPPPDRPKFRSFLYPLPPPSRSFCVSLGVFSLNFGGVFEVQNPSIVHVWALGLCETSAASGPPGFHTTTRELQTCTFDPSASHTTRKPREDPQRETKERNLWWETEKKEPHPSGPHPSAPFWV